VSCKVLRRKEKTLCEVLLTDEFSSPFMIVYRILENLKIEFISDFSFIIFMLIFDSSFNGNMTFSFRSNRKVVALSPNATFLWCVKWF